MALLKYDCAFVIGSTHGKETEKARYSSVVERRCKEFARFSEGSNVGTADCEEAATHARRSESKGIRTGGAIQVRTGIEVESAWLRSRANRLGLSQRNGSARPLG